MLSYKGGEMTTILIVDACKPSLVMTSEVFKDKIPGTVVHVSSSGKEAIEFLKDQEPNLCVVDFDLPDVDGPSLVEAMRKLYTGPILMTAYPDAMVKEAVTKHLFAFNDASGWIKKPVSFEELSKKIDLYLVEGHRLGKRFDSHIKTQLVGKAAGRGKRAPKVEGEVINLSLGGACIKIDGSMKMKKAQELTISLTIPQLKSRGARKNLTTETKKSAQKTKAGTKTPAGAETKIKATVAWINKAGEVGLQFSKLTDIQKKGLEKFFRSSAK